jgi:hypothetical protein
MTIHYGLAEVWALQDIEGVIAVMLRVITSSAPASAVVRLSTAKLWSPLVAS